MSGYLRIDEEIRKELGDGEEALWSAQPNPSRLFTPIDIFLVPFSLLWAGGVSFGFFGAMADSPFFLFKIFISFFFIAGLYITIGRFVYKYIKKKRTIYLLTNKRAVEMILGRSRKIKSLYYSQISGLNNTCNRNGAGKITFDNGNAFANMYMNTGMDFFMTRNDGYPRFYDLKDVDKPLGIIKKLVDEVNNSNR